MYDLYSYISRLLSQPLTTVVYSTNISIIVALFLGFVGSVSPCQISANLGAISYFGNRLAQQKRTWVEVVFYLLGKGTVYVGFGILVWIFGRSISSESVPIFMITKKAFGPLMVMIGLFLLGWVRLPGNIGHKLSDRIEQFSNRIGGNRGAYLMGVAFSLGFCPTMVWLFFGALMPLTLKSSLGIVLPPIFAIGTAMPLLIFLGIFIAVGLDRVMMKKAKQWGSIVQKIAGIVFILLGLNDIWTYWVLSI